MKKCNTIYSFTNSIEQKLIEEKTQKLNVILNYVLTSTETFTPEFYAEILKMFSINVFRTLKNPIIHNEFEYDYENDEEDIYIEPAWLHLRLIYAILYKVLSFKFNEV